MSVSPPVASPTNFDIGSVFGSMVNDVLDAFVDVNATHEPNINITNSNKPPINGSDMRLRWDSIFAIMGGTLATILLVSSVLFLIRHWRWWKLRGPGPKPRMVRTWHGWVPMDEYDEKQTKKRRRRLQKKHWLWKSTQANYNWIFFDPTGEGKRQYEADRLQRSYLKWIPRKAKDFLGTNMEEAPWRPRLLSRATFQNACQPAFDGAEGPGSGYHIPVVPCNSPIDSTIFNRLDSVVGEKPDASLLVHGDGSEASAENDDAATGESSSRLDYAASEISCHSLSAGRSHHISTCSDEPELDEAVVQTITSIRPGEYHEVDIGTNGPNKDPPEIRSSLSESSPDPDISETNKSERPAFVGKDWSVVCETTIESLQAVSEVEYSKATSAPATLRYLSSEEAVKRDSGVEMDIHVSVERRKSIKAFREQDDECT